MYLYILKLMLSIHQKNQGPYENVKSKKKWRKYNCKLLRYTYYKYKKKICRPCTVKSPNRIWFLKSKIAIKITPPPVYLIYLCSTYIVGYCCKCWSWYQKTYQKQYYLYFFVSRWDEILTPGLIICSHSIYIRNSFE